MDNQNLIKYDEFLICPVRNATDKQKDEMELFIKKEEDVGKKIYYPARDTCQEDLTGFNICCDNARAISESLEVCIYYDKNSSGSLFDLGVAFALNKPLRIINLDDLEKTVGKSFTNMIIEWSSKE